MNIDTLVRKFGQVNLALVPWKVPIGGSSTENVFQLDIKKKDRQDVFAVWPGDEHNTAIVQASDKKLEQVVLLVKEEKHQFWEQLTTRRDQWFLRMDPKEEDVRKRFMLRDRVEVKKNDGVWWASRETPDTTRHFLVGKDERHLFMAALPGAATSILAAHRVLKSRNLVDHEAKGHEHIRQGEWFFVELNQAEFWEIENLAKKNPAVVKAKQSLNGLFGSRGRAHIVDELVTYKALGSTGTKIYVRGKVKHPDHKTIQLYQWREVIKNTEGSSARSGASLLGGTWID
jgi:hypothetical protein